MAGIFKNGLVHVYYGDGQGKTSAAVGLAVRASGCGCRVLYVQFLKNGRSGELKAMKNLADWIDVLAAIPCVKFFADMDEQEKAQAAAEQCDCFAEMQRKVASGGYDMLILDEVIDAVELGMIGHDSFHSFIGNKPPNLEIAITGHSLPQSLMELADYVSEVKKVKHPYDRGIGARKGAEF